MSKYDGSVIKGYSKMRLSDARQADESVSIATLSCFFGNGAKPFVPKTHAPSTPSKHITCRICAINKVDKEGDLCTRCTTHKFKD